MTSRRNDVVSNREFTAKIAKMGCRVSAVIYNLRSDVRGGQKDWLERGHASTLVHRQVQRPAMKVMRYFFVGGTAAAVYFVLFAILAKLIGLLVVIIHWLQSLVLATLVNYVLSIKHVFESGVRFEKHRELMLVFTVSAFGLAINQAVLWLCIEFLGVDLLVSKLIGTGCVFYWNYGVRRNYIFRAA